MIYFSAKLVLIVEAHTTESRGLELTPGLVSIEKTFAKTVMATALQCTLQNNIQNIEQIPIPSLFLSVIQDQNHLSVKFGKPSK